MESVNNHNNNNNNNNNNNSNASTSTGSVTSIYLGVVDDVISNVRTDFLESNVDEAVLSELQQLWELKMMQSGTIQLTSEASLPRGNTGATPIHDLNVPYQGTEEYETPTAEMLFPPTPLTNNEDPAMYQYFPVGSSEPTPMREFYHGGNMNDGSSTPYMQPAPWINQKPLGVDVNIAYEEARENEQNGPTPETKDFLMLSTGKRKLEDYAANFVSGSYIPQQDGSSDTDPTLTPLVKGIPTTQVNEGSVEWEAQRMLWRSMDACTQARERVEADTLLAKLANTRTSRVPQLDGINDNYDDDVAEEDYNDATEGGDVHESGYLDEKAQKLEATESDGSEPPLNEEDDEVDDVDQGDEELNTDHLVVAQFEKVTRTKNKWKCILKDGVMNLYRRDYLFSKANGEFEF